MGWTTIIIAGIPKTDEYRAISYVWGNAPPHAMKRMYCGYSFSIPVESAYKFRRIMMMTAKSGESIWLDALSIDQTDHEEKSKMLAVMGDIYSRANIVAVLFPIEDGEGFKTVYDITCAATAINLNKFEFYQEGQDGHENPRLIDLSRVCQRFYQMIGQFNQNLHKYKYWRRFRF